MDITVPVLCDDRASFNSAVAALSSSRTLYFDCEGVKLGTAGGTLSLITIRSAPSPSNSRQSNGDRNGQTFIFDITSLTLARQPVSLKPLFALLTSPKVLKVVWDGRMDSSALHHYFRVDVRNVLDLQLVDIHSRELRGETIQEHVKRFIGGVDPRTLSNENRAIQTYALVHRLSGLSQAVTEHQPSVGKQLKKIPVDHSVWDARPLPQPYIDYAARDVDMIAILHALFKSRLYITNTRLPSLLSQSALYVSFWSGPGRQPTQATNYFLRSSFLPLEINTEPAPGPTKMCGKCRRYLTEASFSQNAWRMNEGSNPGEVNLNCWVCRAVKKNERHWRMVDNIRQKKMNAAARK